LGLGDGLCPCVLVWFADAGVGVVGGGPVQVVLALDCAQMMTCAAARHPPPQAKQEARRFEQSSAASTSHAHATAPPGYRAIRHHGVGVAGAAGAAAGAGAGVGPAGGAAGAAQGQGAGQGVRTRRRADRLRPPLLELDPAQLACLSRTCCSLPWLRDVRVSGAWTCVRGWVRCCLASSEAQGKCLGMPACHAATCAADWCG